MENLVIQVDELDSDINAAKTAMTQGISLAEKQINVLFEKIARHTRLNDELVKIRDGESLMSCAAHVFEIA